MYFYVFVSLWLHRRSYRDRLFIYVHSLYRTANERTNNNNNNNNKKEEEEEEKRRREVGEEHNQ